MDDNKKDKKDEIRDRELTMYYVVSIVSLIGFAYLFLWIFSILT